MLGKFVEHMVIEKYLWNACYVGNVCGIHGIKGLLFKTMITFNISSLIIFSCVSKIKMCTLPYTDPRALVTFTHFWPPFSFYSPENSRKALVSWFFREYTMGAWYYLFPWYQNLNFEVVMSISLVISFVKALVNPDLVLLSYFIFSFKRALSFGNCNHFHKCLGL